MSLKLNVSAPTDFVHAASVNFNGSLPAGTPTSSSRGFVWATGAVGSDQGLITPSTYGIDVPLRIMRVALVLAGQDTFRVDIIDGTSVIPLASGTTATAYHGLNLGLLTYGQSLKVTTTGAGTSAVKMVCTLAPASHLAA